MDILNFIAVIGTAAITGGFTLIGVIIKDNKKDAVREVKENARFEKIETAIITSAEKTELKSDMVVKEIKADIRRLEEAQKKYNNLQERTLKNEQSLKSLHKRVDLVEGGRYSHEE